jgi:hypothetical protein
VERFGTEVFTVETGQPLLSFGPFGVSVCDGPYRIFKWQTMNAFLIELTDRYLRVSPRPRVRFLGRRRGGASFEIPYDSIVSVKLSPHPARLGLMQVLDITYRDGESVHEKSIATYNQSAERAFAILKVYAPPASRPEAPVPLGD